NWNWHRRRDSSRRNKAGTESMRAARPSPRGPHVLFAPLLRLGRIDSADLHPFSAFDLRDDDQVATLVICTIVDRDVVDLVLVLPPSHCRLEPLGGQVLARGL